MDKPAPLVTSDSRRFWEGCQQNELLFQHCMDCNVAQFYPRTHCANCQSDNLEWQRSSGRGEVYSFSVVERPTTSAFKADVPYVIALVDMAEGYRMMMNLRHCPPDAAHIGMAVKVFFEPVEGSEWSLPQAEPAEPL
ncbi:MAG: Zn-ribbon domain-containing OB-fold protein [Gammaproteobacteria bacterium]|nr:Zn-ribbon domain-containing OB-fold protein [Gammaproteobacteria bacterium]